MSVHPQLREHLRNEFLRLRKDIINRRSNADIVSVDTLKDITLVLVQYDDLIQNKFFHSRDQNVVAVCERLRYITADIVTAIRDDNAAKLREWYSPPGDGMKIIRVLDEMLTSLKSSS